MVLGDRPRADAGRPTASATCVTTHRDPVDAVLSPCVVVFGQRYVKSTGIGTVVVADASRTRPCCSSPGRCSWSSTGWSACRSAFRAPTSIREPTGPPAPRGPSRSIAGQRRGLAGCPTARLSLRPRTAGRATSRPASAGCCRRVAAGARGRFSSSRTRTGQNEIARQVQRSERLFLGHRRELIEEMVESLSRLMQTRRRRCSGIEDRRRRRCSGFETCRAMLSAKTCLRFQILTAARPVRSTACDVGRDCRGRARVAYPGLPDEAEPRACGTAGPCGPWLLLDSVRSLRRHDGKRRVVFSPSPQAGAGSLAAATVVGVMRSAGLADGETEPRRRRAVCFPENSRPVATSRAPIPPRWVIDRPVSGNRASHGSPHPLRNETAPTRL